MDWRDNRKLLDQPVGRVAPPLRRDGLLVLAIVGVFFAGISVGGLIFAHKTEPPTRTASNDGTAELSFFLNGVPVTRHN